MPIIEVAIGLVFAYMLLSILCTFINEWIAKLFSLRSKNLKNGLHHLLADEEIVHKVFNHQLIKGSVQGSDITKKGPSYIASENFARVLIDIINDKSDGEAKRSENSNDIINALNKAQLPENLKSAMTGLIDDGNATINDLRKNLQTWFDNSMERISGWYKRKLQFITLLIAIALAFSFNVDTISISKTLWQNPVLRTEIADQAAVAVVSCKEKEPEKCSFLKENYNALEELKKLPVGWPNGVTPFNPANWSFLKIIGCFITALATSLGAPFWFDVLDKLNSIRSSGIKPLAKNKEK